MTPATRSVLVLGGRPLVLVDVNGEGQDGPLSRPTDPIVWSFVDAGLRLLPGFLGQALTVTPRLQLDVDDDVSFVTEADGEVALVVPMAELDDAWRAAVRHHGGCLLLLGRDIDLPGDADAASVGARLDEVARGGRLVGGVVDVPGGGDDALPVVITGDQGVDPDTTSGS